MAARRTPGRARIGLALAGGGPFGAIYEIGALTALQEALEGVDLERLDCYVGVSAGGFLAAALANGVPVEEVYRRFIEDGEGEAALAPELFMRPALREYGQRARAVPALAARVLWEYARHPLARQGFRPLAALGRAVPTGLFDNESIHEYLQAVFAEPGRTNDFRRLRRRLYLVATDLDTGESVSFGRPGHDRVPISRAVQASAALPGLFPPVAIGGRHYVDGALRKTLHASEALDDGMDLVICVNPIVPFDASRVAGGHPALVEGGLPVVLSQTFRAVIHSRMAVGMSKYAAQYPGADVVLFQPASNDREIFFTSLFGYAARRRVCEHAYRRTRESLLARRATLEPVFARHGIRVRWAKLADPHRPLRAAPPVRPGRGELHAAARHLAGTLGELRRWADEQEQAPAA